MLALVAMVAMLVGGYEDMMVFLPSLLFLVRLLTLLFFYYCFFFIAKTFVVFGTDLKPVSRFYFVAERKLARIGAGVQFVLPGTVAKQEQKFTVYNRLLKRVSHVFVTF